MPAPALRILLVQPASFFLPGTDLVEDEVFAGLVRTYYKLRSAGTPGREFAVGLALPLLAALVPAPVAEIRIVNAAREAIPYDDAFDIVGITLATAQAVEAWRIAAEFRARGVHVAVGGSHVSLVPDEAVAHADTIFVGEADDTWPLFINEFRAGRARPRYDGGRNTNLAKLPAPRVDLLAPIDRQQVFVQWSRGCPRGCSYCSVPKLAGATLRTKPVRQMVEEVRELRDATGSRSFFFADDNMLLDPALAAPLLDGLAALGISWATQTEVSVAREPDLLRRMRDSGCVSVLLGLEDVVPDGLASLSRFKRGLIDRYAEDVINIQAHGVQVCGAFIFGTDAHDEGVFEGVRAFSLETGMARLQASVLTPLPGTRVRRRLEAEGRLLDKPWSNYNFFGVNFVPRRIGAAELRRGTVTALLEHPGRWERRDVVAVEHV